jgi:cation-transporting P-type ATPase E
MQLDATESARGLSRAEVDERVRHGQVNVVPDRVSRTTAEIVRSNVVTRFNILLGALLVIVLVVLREPRDALFGIVLVTNSAIGIIQELRAKRTLDRLELLAAPQVRVIRDGRSHEVAPESVVLDDLIDLRSGDQLVVDAVVVESRGLEIDESLLTGESDPVHKRPEDECRSGSFVAAGHGTVRATRVGADSYAAQLIDEAREFRLVPSELRDGVDRFLRLVGWIVGPTMVLLLWSGMRGGGQFLEALAGSVAAGVAMVPQGLVLLTSVAFAVGVIRLGQRNVLVQELAAVEGLARVDVVCFDKTGTLTEGRLSVQELVPLAELDPAPALGALAAMEEHPNATMAAIRKAFPKDPGWTVVNAAAFSSARKWSGAAFGGHGTWVLGAPEVVAGNDSRVEQIVRRLSEAGSRALVLAKSDGALRDGALPSAPQPVAVLSLRDRIRTDASETLGYFASQGVRMKVISGDHPQTVASIAREVGIDGEVVDARHLPEDPDALAAIMEKATVFGRVAPHQKRAMVQAMQSRGHVVAMTGDGVNDVLALKASDIGVAMGDAAPASRAVSQLVVIDGSFSALPFVVGEGRRVLSNVERVANLFVTGTVYAFGLSVAIVLAALPFPFLPRHLTLVGSLTIGIPAFFIALAPSRRRVRPGFVMRVLKFAVPVGLTATVATFAAYWLADTEAATVEQSRTTATLVLAAIGLLAVGIVSRPLVPWKKGLIGAMGALLVLAFVNTTSRELFELELPRLVILLAALGIVGVTAGIMLLALRSLGWVKAMSEMLRDHSPTSPETWRQLTTTITESSGWNESFPATTELHAISRPDDKRA